MLSGFDSCLLTGMILINLQKDFDTLNHHILLKKCLPLGFKIIKQTTIIHKTFWTNSSFHKKYRATGKVQFLFFRRFLLVLTKCSFREKD